MARIVPSDITRPALAGRHTGELATLAYLKKALSDDYTVLHGVHWSREYAKWTHFGEVDFVIVNQGGDVLLIEQKNGLLSETGAGLIKRYEDGDKNVSVQIRRSVDKIRAKFDWQHGNGAGLALDYLIYCPDHRVLSVNAAALDMSRIVDANAKDGLAQRIESVLGPGVAQDDAWHAEVLEFFRQTLELVPDIHAHIGAHETAFVRRVGGLANLLSHIDMHPFRVRITGTAGCGKSLVARDMFDRAVEQGRRPLLLCFNRTLSERLKANVAKGGYVNTWNGFCAKFLESRGKALDYARMQSDPDFWKNVQEQVMAETIPKAWIFDTLVVDEGQDFEDEWYDIARLFLAEDSDILWLEEPGQNIYGKPPVTLEGFVGYRADVNYRSPDGIAQFIRKMLPFEFDSGNDLPGLGVGVHGYRDAEDQPRIAGRVIRDLLKQGLTYDDIVILTCRGAANSVFSRREKVGNVKLRRFTGGYDLFGNQVLTDGRLTFDSVFRFKGQEAPAVILADVDPDPEKRERDARLLYCGMTRATVRLELLVNETNPDCRRFL
jgi:hypothetical protein